MAQVPHFDLPFRYSRGQAAVNEQGSESDIAACVFAVCATEPGQFYDAPEFGFPDLFASQEPLSAQRIEQVVSSQEPRASLLVQVNPQQFAQSVIDADIEIA